MVINLDFVPVVKSAPFCVQTFNYYNLVKNVIVPFKSANQVFEQQVYLMKSDYRGRIAPTPTGYLHLGHARTFWIAQQRAQEAGGNLIYRCEDLDPDRCKPEFAQAAIDDLRWFGCSWSEGPDVGGTHGPYLQSGRIPFFLDAWKSLKEAGVIYPCNQSRRDVADATQAPHEDSVNREPLYPKKLRPPVGTGRNATAPGNTNWRFRVPDNRKIEFEDSGAGFCSFVCQRDFGDFLVWRKDGFPSYELAVVVDDAAMHISEVVRGNDLLLSTARQILLYEALGLQPPRFHHVPLLCDSTGRRLAKRHHSLSLRELRAAGHTPEKLRCSDQWSRCFSHTQNPDCNTKQS